MIQEAVGFFLRSGFVIIRSSYNNQILNPRGILGRTKATLALRTCQIGADNDLLKSKTTFPYTADNRGIVVIARGSGSSRYIQRDQVLNGARILLMVDLLAKEEDKDTRKYRFDPRHKHHIIQSSG